MTEQTKTSFDVSLDERLEAGRKAFAEYERSKFSKYGGSSSMFAAYWIAATICAFDGHRPEPIKKPHHLPRCERCNNMVFQSDKLAVGCSYPKAPKCPGCWRERMQVNAER